MKKRAANSRGTLPLEKRKKINHVLVKLRSTISTKMTAEELRAAIVDLDERKFIIHLSATEVRAPKRHQSRGDRLAEAEEMAEEAEGVADELAEEMAEWRENLGERFEDKQSELQEAEDQLRAVYDKLVEAREALREAVAEAQSVSFPGMY